MTDSDYPLSHSADTSKTDRTSQVIERAGCILGGFLALIIVAAILFPLTASNGRPPRNHTQCLTNTKYMAFSLIIYAEDNDECFPPAKDWMDSVLVVNTPMNAPGSERLLHDPELIDDKQYGYAFRSKAACAHVKGIEQPARFALIFDSTLTGRNASSEPATMPRPGRHSNLDMVSFADGHAKRILVPQQLAVPMPFVQ